MNSDLQHLLDRTAIRDVLERYCRGIDRLDAELVSSVYWDEATDDHGIFQGLGKDFAAFVIPMLREHFSGTMHMLGQSLIELDGQRARAESYFVAYHWSQQEGHTALDTAAGRYVDVLEQRGGEWRLLQRVVVMEWTRREPQLTKMDMPLTGFTWGRRDRLDPAYGQQP